MRWSRSSCQHPLQAASPHCHRNVQGPSPGDLRDPTPSLRLAPPSALRLRAGTLSGQSPPCPRRITQYAASWAKPQTTSVRTGGWWRRQHTVRAWGSLGYMGGASVAASSFAFPDSSPPQGPRRFPLSYSDAPNLGCYWGLRTCHSVFQECTVLPFASSTGLNVSSPGKLIWPPGLD